MSQQVDAIYDDGVFKPLTPLSLPDKVRVKLTVDAAPTAESDDVLANQNVALDELLRPVREAFAASGLSEDEAAELFEAEKHALRQARR